MRRLHRRSSSGQRGAAAVETAIVLPLVIFLSIAFIDVVLLLRDYTAVSAVVRDAARVASANPRVGNVEGHRGGPPPTEAEESFAYLAAQIVETTGSALPKETIDELWVYKANRDGFPTIRDDGNWKLDTNTVDPFADGKCVPRNCVRYAWTPPTETTEGFFGLASTIVPAPTDGFGLPWDPASINACPSTVPSTLPPTDIPDGEAVGVFLRVEHRGITNAFFNADATITDRTVIKFEPRSPTSCRPNP